MITYKILIDTTVTALFCNNHACKREGSITRYRVASSLIRNVHNRRLPYFLSYALLQNALQETIKLSRALYAKIFHFGNVFKFINHL